ncbi:STAS domain-containing protein [Streptomyces sp. NPDC048257]|uniref:STAS domain-containing protein n=1 Tax=Streptomyces sp. NPDC048257 TaxID=3365526 RepID=UPI0037221BFB
MRAFDGGRDHGQNTLQALLTRAVPEYTRRPAGSAAVALAFAGGFGLTEEWGVRLEASCRFNRLPRTVQVEGGLCGWTAGPEVCMESPKVTVRSEADGVYVVGCAGEFDQDTVGVLRAACEREAADAKLLVLDIRNVVFADSSFLNTMLGLRNTRPLVLEGPLPDQLHRLLELTGALALFRMRDDGGDSAQAG